MLRTAALIQLCPVTIVLMPETGQVSLTLATARARPSILSSKKSVHCDSGLYQLWF